MPAISFGITALALGLPDASASTLVVAVLSGLALQLVLTLLPNNLWEEVAWTGFVQHRLQQRHDPLDRLDDEAEPRGLQPRCELLQAHASGSVAGCGKRALAEGLVSLD